VIFGQEDRVAFVIFAELINIDQNKVLIHDAPCADISMARTNNRVNR
jgi:hypothetical protein